jgi:putative Mn2+ efflux pump MntP
MSEYWISFTAVIGSIIVMLGGGWFVFERLKAKNQGFGPNSLKALGVVLFLPTLVILGVAVTDFQSETLAALLGTVAGYVLSLSEKDSNTS